MVHCFPDCKHTWKFRWFEFISQNKIHCTRVYWYVPPPPAQGLTVQSAACTDGLMARHACLWSLIWLSWASGQDSLPCLVRRGTQGMAGWRARERSWFISASGTHLAGPLQGLCGQGKWEATGTLSPSWDPSNSEKRGESSSCWGWYLYNDSVRGRKWNRFCWDTFLLHPAAHGRIQRGDLRRASVGHAQACRDAPGSVLVPGCQSPSSCARDCGCSSQFSQLCPLLSLHLRFPLWWEEPDRSPAALRECCEGAWDYSSKTQHQPCTSVEYCQTLQHISMSISYTITCGFCGYLFPNSPICSSKLSASLLPLPLKQHTLSGCRANMPIRAHLPPCLSRGLGILFLKLY